MVGQNLIALNFGSPDHGRAVFCNFFTRRDRKWSERCMRRKSSVDLKVVVLGSASVGKTSIIRRYCNNDFEDGIPATVGAGFFVHTRIVRETEVTLMLWDTAGEERFRSVAPSLLRGANALILVFDLTEASSFPALDDFLEMFLDTVNVNNYSAPPILLLGNKSDLGPSIVPQKAIDEWLRKNRINLFFSVSAKTSHNIDAAFAAFVEALIQPQNFVDQPELRFVVQKEDGRKSSFCC
jgi:small GTP-binding protein